MYDGAIEFLMSGYQDNNRVYLLRVLDTVIKRIYLMDRSSVVKRSIGILRNEDGTCLFIVECTIFTGKLSHTDLILFVE